MVRDRAVEKITKAIVSITAIIGLVILEYKAIELGIDGVMLGIVIATIAGLAGYNVKDLIKKIE
ncbi:MAG TPA: hypothetical protein ENI53_01810 [Thermoplasmatales archaeon]|nr:hypothetical protein [Thermoplasmatales archaeon]